MYKLYSIHSCDLPSVPVYVNMYLKINCTLLVLCVYVLYSIIMIYSVLSSLDPRNIPSSFSKMMVDVMHVAEL